MKTTLAVLLATGLLAQPLIASAPPYTSEAPIAYMKDLSSGAVLYDKGGQTRIPPASMAKMMTAHVAFRLIQKGDLKLDTEFEVRPEVKLPPYKGLKLVKQVDEVKDEDVRDGVRGLTAHLGGTAMCNLTNRAANDLFIGFRNFAAQRGPSI